MTPTITILHRRSLSDCTGPTEPRTSGVYVHKRYSIRHQNDRSLLYTQTCINMSEDSYHVQILVFLDSYISSLLERLNFNWFRIRVRAHQDQWERLRLLKEIAEIVEGNELFSGGVLQRAHAQSGSHRT